MKRDPSKRSGIRHSRIAFGLNALALSIVVFLAVKHSKTADLESLPSGQLVGETANRPRRVLPEVLSPEGIGASFEKVLEKYHKKRRTLPESIGDLVGTAGQFNEVVGEYLDLSKEELSLARMALGELWKDMNQLLLRNTVESTLPLNEESFHRLSRGQVSNYSNEIGLLSDVTSYHMKSYSGGIERLRKFHEEVATSIGLHEANVMVEALDIEHHFGAFGQREIYVSFGGFKNQPTPYAVVFSVDPESRKILTGGMSPLKGFSRYYGSFFEVEEIDNEIGED